MQIVNGLSLYKSPAELQAEVEDKVCDIVSVLLSNEIGDVDANKIAAKLYGHFNPILLRSNNVSVDQCEMIIQKKVEQITNVLLSGMRISKVFLQENIADKPRSRSSLVMDGDDSRMIDWIENLEGDLFSPSEVAKIMNKTSRTISEWIRNGTINKVPGLKKHKSIPVSEVVRIYREKQIYCK